MSLLQDAFAGIKSMRNAIGGEPQTPHGQFIHNEVLPLTSKLQREVRGRRCKEVQKKLQESILLLRPFQNEDWPPRKGGPPPFSIDTVPGGKIEDLDDVDTTDPAVFDTDSGAGDFHEDNGVIVSPLGATLGAITDDEQSILPRNPAVEDPEALDPVHISISSLVDTLILIMNSPAKTNRACELSMQLISLLVSKRYLSGVAGGQADITASGPHKSEGQESLLHRVLEGVAKVAESNNELVYVPVIDTLKTIMTSPKCGIHEASMLLALRTTFHVYLVTKSETCKNSAKMALLDMLRSVFSRMEAYEAVSKNQQMYKPYDAGTPATPGKTDQQHHQSDGSVASASFTSQYHTDSYVLFRALCKLSSKALPADTHNESTSRLFNTQAVTDPLALNSKILSLELILAAMNFCGEAFCEGERFIHLVQHYLCSSLLKNCMSEQTQIAFISQKIFLVLVYKFKAHLKQEIEIFLSNVFLKVLDSPNSSFKQKALVLESLRSLSNDPALLTQIFLNYDCDFDAMNLYREIIHMLTKLAGKATSGPSLSATRKDAEEEMELTLAAIEVLVTTMKAMLRALGLPEEGRGADDTAGSKIRCMLSIDVVGTREPKDSSPPSAAVSESGADDISLADRITTAVGDFEEIGNSDVAGLIVDAFKMKQNAEQNFEIGAVKFTLSLKGGLTFFIDNGFVQLDAREIALFFLANKEKLDKTQMGEALGREPNASFVKEKGLDAEKGGPGFWLRILHHYVGALDFSGMVFDEAIRLFLSGFRLPGEAQKIDRIMEKFAEKFTSQNPDVFPSADTAFILAFSTIMLNTDLHNPSIKPEKRMTVDSFIRNNRGIGENGADLPNEMLEGIFNRIKASPFSLKEDDEARERVAQKQTIFDTPVFFEGPALFGATVEQRKRETFKKEKDDLMAQTERLIRRRPEKNTRGTTVKPTNLNSIAPSDVVRPMFDLTWGPLLGTLSQVLECCDDDRSVAVCLSGFVYAVRISAHSRMSLARDTFVSSLAKFTFLGSIKEMKRKNIESVRTLLSIAIVDGEFLGESWEPVLQCISQLARLRLSASGLDSDESFLGKQKKTPPTPRSDFDLFRTTSRLDIAREAEGLNGKAVLEAVEEALMDKVFSSTVKLSAQSLARFIEQMIAVSRSEISGNSKSVITGIDSGRMKNQSSHGGDGPSIYSLQRLVEVADYNMDVRPRLVWAQVWEVLADFFAEIACHENAMVSVFAIDSLKQLSSKFLEKPELSEFNFQRLFLRPFLVVMEDKGSRLEVREMVLQCVSNIVMTKSHNLRSGWKVVYAILHHSASDGDTKIESLGMGILQRLLDEHLNELCNITDEEQPKDEHSALTSIERRNRNANVDDFVGLCRASLSFVGRERSGPPLSLGLSLRAFCHTAIYADLLASKRVLPAVSGAQSTDPDAPGYTYEGLDEQGGLEMIAWRPLLEGLVKWVRSPATDAAGGVGCILQRGSILALRAILLRHGHVFSTPQWVAILTQTLLPAIQAGAESDDTPVLKISSESPFVSSIDFLADPLPLPPAVEDNRLRLFESNMDSSSKRTLGPAELMLEASFTDLRHGGDGDLSRAYLLAKKEDISARPTLEEPFPNSWLATTAPSALGLLTDISSEVAIPRGREGSEHIWPIIVQQYKTWCVGHGGGYFGSMRAWSPCEAVVRVSCRELQRFSFRLSGKIFGLDKEVAGVWAACVLESFAGVIRENVKIEDSVRESLVRRRQEFFGRKQKDLAASSDVSANNKSLSKRSLISLQHGGDKEDVPVSEKQQTNISGEENANISTLNESKQAAIDETDRSDSVYIQNAVATLKIRSISLHLLHQTLCSILDRVVPVAPKHLLSDLIDTLNESRITAERAVGEQDVAVAFQEALMNDWGHGVDEMQTAIEGSSHLHGSAMFFLTQEAGATHATISMLSILYKGVDDSVDSEKWDREAFAEPHLHAVIQGVMAKFVASERRDSHRIAPNVWRNASESGGKVAFYCTSFASVIVEILTILSAMREDQFRKLINSIYPSLCDLIGVQSDEIRQLVKGVMEKQVFPIVTKGLQAG